MKPALVFQFQPVLAPCLVKQRQRAAGKRVEECAGAIVALVQRVRGDAFRVMGRQRAIRTQQAHEGGRDAHILQLRVLQRDTQPARIARHGRRLGLQRFDVAGGKRQRRGIMKAHIVRQRILAGHAMAAQPQFQHAHRLEVFEAVWLGEQALDYSRLKSPLRGRHRSNSSPV
jgi:hypothetical protein